MRMLAFSNRNLKEIVRDPLTVAFSLGFPLVLLLLLSAIQANIPVPMFEIETLAPGMCIFGLTFMTLFSATLIARDRETSFLRRLYTTPMRAGDFICGYMLRRRLCARIKAGSRRFVVASEHRSRVAVFHCAGTFVRQPAHRKAGRRHMRCAAHEPCGVALRHMV